MTIFKIKKNSAPPPPQKRGKQSPHRDETEGTEDAAGT